MVVSILEGYCLLQLGEILILVLIWTWLRFQSSETSSRAGFIPLLALACVLRKEENRLSTHPVKTLIRRGKGLPSLYQEESWLGIKQI